MAGKQNEPLLGRNSPAAPGDPVDLGESVAGEEDPGASFDVPEGKVSKGRQPTGGQAPMAPGDEAVPGTSSTGENVCPVCGGSGRQGASQCPNCEGTGVVTVGIGGA